MKFLKTQKGFVPVALLIGLSILAGTVAAAYYFGRKAAFEHKASGPEGPVDPPQSQITFQKSFNLISLMAREKDILAIKDLGANTVTLFYAATIGRESEFPKQRLANAIATAHKQGLQVEIRNSYSAEGDPITDIEAHKTRMLNFAADLAQFAQEYKVYRIAPFSEIDNNLFGHEAEVEETAQMILKEVKKHYDGEVGIGIAAPWRGTDYNFKGYDYMSVSVYVQKQTSVEDYFEGRSDISLESVLSGASRVAQRSGIDTLIIGETGVFNPGEERLTAFQTKILSKEEEADYYRKFFEATSGKVQGYSLVYFGYMGIKGDPAEDIVKEWYAKGGETE